jgi:hypothetical protein
MSYGVRPYAHRSYGDFAGVSEKYYNFDVTKAVFDFYVFNPSIVYLEDVLVTKAVFDFYVFNPSIVYLEDVLVTKAVFDFYVFNPSCFVKDYDNLILSDNPVCYVPLNGSVVDISGNNVAFSLVGTPTSSSQAHVPRLKSSYSFNGSNQAIRTTNWQSLNFAQIPGNPNPSLFTVECWIRMTSNPGSTRSIYRYADDGIALEVMSNGFLRCAFINTAGNWVVADATRNTPLNQWNHIALTYDQQAIKIYLNGFPICNQAATDTVWWRSFSTNRAAIACNGRYNSQFFPGLISNFALYTYPLSPEQIYDHYSYGHFDIVRDDSFNDGKMDLLKSTSGNRIGTVPVSEDSPHVNSFYDSEVVLQEVYSDLEWERYLVYNGRVFQVSENKYLYIDMFTTTQTRYWFFTRDGDHFTFPPDFGHENYTNYVEFPRPEEVFYEQYVEDKKILIRGWSIFTQPLNRSFILLSYDDEEETLSLDWVFSDLENFESGFVDMSRLPINSYDIGPYEGSFVKKGETLVAAGGAAVPSGNNFILKSFFDIHKIDFEEGLDDYQFLFVEDTLPWLTESFFYNQQLPINRYSGNQVVFEHNNKIVLMFSSMSNASISAYMVTPFDAGKADRFFLLHCLVYDLLPGNRLSLFKVNSVAWKRQHLNYRESDDLMLSVWKLSNEGYGVFFNDMSWPTLKEIGSFVFDDNFNFVFTSTMYPRLKTTPGLLTEDMWALGDFAIRNTFTTPHDNGLWLIARHPDDQNWDNSLVAHNWNWTTRSRLSRRLTFEQIADANADWMGYFHSWGRTWDGETISIYEGTYDDYWDSTARLLLLKEGYKPLRKGVSQ